ncbi:NAD-dependent epimerase/dehydratase family protein [Candidatus Parcubacteria bacterium]|nr:MAG: NAD-dependent epimerase/dehydratase family protein [Candidatus Parcubacteria bacterium]
MLTGVFVDASFGGAGFIGVNSAKHFAEQGWDITIVDNLSRRGTEDNLKWLTDQHPVDFHKVDIRDYDALADVVRATRPDVLLHLAAQVAVTTSVTDPREDFAINALGTFNVLESVRLQSPESFVINASTNKVYGKMEEVGVVERNGRYEYRDLPAGVDEKQQLDFHSPYGCSKGVADQYTIDYARIYGLRTTTFRQSCIYGTRQFGIEDQGWVAWFTIAAVLGKQITIYGDGKQIRDVLHVKDLARAYESAIEHADAASGQAFNIGGGPANTLSLRELLAYLEDELNIEIPLEWDDWRPGDQPVFVCNTAKAKESLGWQPQIPVRQGIKQLADWVARNKELFEWLR